MCFFNYWFYSKGFITIKSPPFWDNNFASLFPSTFYDIYDANLRFWGYPRRSLRVFAPWKVTGSHHFFRGRTVRPPPMPSRLQRNKALLRNYQPSLSLNNLNNPLIRPYFLKGGGWILLFGKKTNPLTCTKCDVLSLIFNGLNSVKYQGGTLRIRVSSMATNRSVAFVNYLKIVHVNDGNFK